MLLLTVTEL